MNIKSDSGFDFSRLRGESILITGGAGFLGNRVVNRLQRLGFADNIASGQTAQPNNLYINRSIIFDLTQEKHVCDLFSYLKPSIVIHLAAAVGGIGANQKTPGDFFYRNAMMGILCQEYARRNGVKKFVTIGTVCSYPKFTPVPFKESDIWNGYPEETNAAYGIAKKSLLVQGLAYRQQYGFNSVHLLPANLYGPNDNFDDNASHVIPALIKKAIIAKDKGEEYLDIWGDGTPTREFLYVDDAAEAIVRAVAVYDESDPLNIGSGDEVSIANLADTIASLVGFGGQIRFDPSKPNGQPKRKLDSSLSHLKLGSYNGMALIDGLKTTIDWYKNNAR